MKQEELIEMIDATINDNGQKGITGKALNLALKEIVNSAGNGGGGGLMLHYLPRYEIEQILGNPEFPYQDKLNECVAHNKEIFKTIIDCNNNHTPVPGPIYFDTTFFEWYYNGRERSVRGGVATAWFVNQFTFSDGSSELFLNVQSWGSAYGNPEVEQIFSDGLFGEPSDNVS